MLVLLGPPFEGNQGDYDRLALATGLVAYELRTKLKPGHWGVVRALADPQQAVALADRLRSDGFRVAVVDPIVGHDPERKIVPLEALALGEGSVSLRLGQRTMDVPHGALLTIVRGEVKLADQAAGPRSRTSSSTFQAVNPASSDVAVFRENVSQAPVEAFAAADLHFITVRWLARIDARTFDFSVLETVAPSPAQNLDALIDLLAMRVPGLRVDRSIRASSVASYTGRPAAARSLSPPAVSGPPPSRLPMDQHFDAYSRMIAEAERQTRKRGGGAPR